MQSIPAYYMDRDNVVYFLVPSVEPPQDKPEDTRSMRIAVDEQKGKK